MLIITGPTGVGKTELALKLAAALPGSAIINADLGQCYTPLTIGTAKPAWQQEPVSHYLFDILDQPVNFTAFQYRAAVTKLLAQYQEQIQAPIIVGGSGFYLQALLFQSPLVNPNLAEATANSLADQAQFIPSLASDNKTGALADDSSELTDTSLWQQLAQLDPVRAQAIDPEDHYRLQRALAIWQQTGRLPSQCAPQFNPIVPQIQLIILTRETPELYQRIDQRVLEMLASGWLTEVANLQHSNWAEFLLQKRLIGYDDLLRYLTHTLSQQLDPASGQGSCVPNKLTNTGALCQSKFVPDSSSNNPILAPELVLMNGPHSKLAQADSLAQLAPVLHRLAQTGDFTELQVLSPELVPVIKIIQQRTRQYAKRQMSFFRRLARQLEQQASPAISVTWLNLTGATVDSYIKRLLSDQSHQLN